MRHVRTDPACAEFLKPVGPFTLWWSVRRRGVACVKCQLARYFEPSSLPNGDLLEKAAQEVIDRRLQYTTWGKVADEAAIEMADALRDLAQQLNPDYSRHEEHEYEPEVCTECQLRDRLREAEAALTELAPCKPPGKTERYPNAGGCESA